MIGPGGGLPTVPVATRWLCIVLVCTSVIATWGQRVANLGAQQLIYSAQNVRHGEVWRLVTYPFICTQPLSLIVWCCGLWLIGGPLEQRWGSRAYLRFFFLTSIGGAALGLLIQQLIDLMNIFVDLGEAQGPRAAFDGMLMAMAINSPQGRVLFGMVLPMSTRTLLYVVLGTDVISGIMRGEVTDFSVGLGGVIVGWLLCTGRWRPSRWRRRAFVRRPGHLYAVPKSDSWLN